MLKGFLVSFRYSIQYNYIIVVVQMERIAALGIVGTKYKKNVYVSAEAIQNNDIVRVINRNLKTVHFDQTYSCTFVKHVNQVTLE